MEYKGTCYTQESPVPSYAPTIQHTTNLAYISLICAPVAAKFDDTLISTETDDGIKHNVGLNLYHSVQVSEHV